MSDTYRDRLAGAWLENPADVVARDEARKKEEEAARQRAADAQAAEQQRLIQSAAIRDQKRTGTPEQSTARPAPVDFTSPFIQAIQTYADPDNPEAARNRQVQGLLGIRENAPDWAMIPTDLALRFREEIQASNNPVDTEYRLNSAYLLSRTQGIPLIDAIRDHDVIMENLYNQALSPKSAWEAISTTYQAAEVGIRIADLAYKLWEKNIPPEQIERDPLYQEILALEGSMPPMDMIKRNLPTKALKYLAQFLPSRLETMKAGAAQGIMGAGAGAVVGSMYTGTVMNMTGISAVLGGASAVPGLGVVTVPLIALLGYKVASSAGAALRSREIETGSAYYDMLRFRDPITGERINPGVARGFAGIYGGLAGMVEVVQTDAVFDRIFGIGTKARKMLNNAAEESLKDRAAQAARSGVVQRQLLRFIGGNLEGIAHGVKEVSKETLQEVVQEGLNIAAEEVAKDITNRVDMTDISPADAKTVRNRLKEVLVSSALGFSAMYAAPGAIRMFAQGAQTTAEGKKAADVYKAEEVSSTLELKPEEAEVFMRRVQEPLPKGTRVQPQTEIEGEQYILKMGDKDGKRAGFVRFTVEPNTEAAEGEAPGTVHIQGMEKGMAPNVAAALMRSVAFRFPGWNVEWEARTPTQEALKKYLISTNPRGNEAGLQPFEQPRDIPTRVSENYIRQRIRDVAPGWKDDEVEVSAKWVRAWARMMGMTGDELANKVFDPRVFGRNITTEMAAQGVTGSATMVRFGNQIRTLIDMSRNANPSTFMHETTHAVVWFAQANRSADPRVGQFIQELEAALGVEGGNWEAEFKGWTKNYTYQNRSNYEALAYALEDYFRTGQAPRPELQSLFQRMAEWVAAVVKGLTGARVDLSPELRAYFDKLVADPASPFSEAYNGETEETIQADLAEQPKGETPEDEELLEIFQGPARAVGREKLRELQQTRLRGTAEGRREGETGWAQRAGRWYRQGPAPEVQEGTQETQATIEATAEAMTPETVQNPVGVYEEVKAYEDRGPLEEPTEEEIRLFQGSWEYRSETIAKEKIRGALPGRQILATMRGAGVKEDEIHWLGLDEFLDTDEKIQPAALQEFIEGNKLEISEEEQGQRYSQYTMPGGRFYREILFVLPRLEEQPTRMVPKTPEAEAKSAETLEKILMINKKIQNLHLAKVYDVQGPDGIPNASRFGMESRLEAEAFRDQYSPGSPVIERRPTQREVENLRDHLVKIRDMLENQDAENYEEVPVPLSEIPTWRRPEPVYRSPHWGAPNVLAHARLKERSDPDGNPMTFIEEIQSDWHQEGRDRGYSPKSAKGVPDAPFKKTWHEFVFKRMVSWAVNRGQKYLAWTTGKEQADRYNLATQIKEIEYIQHKEQWLVIDEVGGVARSLLDEGAARHYAYTYNYDQGRIKKKTGDLYLLSMVAIDGSDKEMGPYTPEELPGVVGKEIAQKIVSGEGKKYRGHEGRTLEGLDLQIGGEGMRNFYDRDLVNYANKLGKPFGAQVEKQTFPDGGRWILVNSGTGVNDGAQIGQESFKSKIDAEQWAEAHNVSYYDVKQTNAEYHALPITDALAERARRGLPLFQGDPGKILDVPEGDAMAAIEALLDAKEGQVQRAVYRPEVGWIAMYWGEPGDPEMDYSGGYGVSHINDKHEEKDKVLAMIPQILRYGTIHEQRGAPDRVVFFYKGFRAAVRLDWNGKPQPWLVTAYLWRDQETGEPLYPQFQPGGRPSTGSFDRHNVKRPDINPPKDGRLYQGDWTYKSEHVVGTKIRGALPGRQALATLRGAGVKEEEIHWTGLDTFLDTDEKRSPQQILDHLSANRLQIQEETLGISVEAEFQKGKAAAIAEGFQGEEFKKAYGRLANQIDPDFESEGRLGELARPAVELRLNPKQTRYESYTIPGGENYREVLFIWKENISKETPREMGKRLFGDDVSINDRPPDQLEIMNQEIQRQVSAAEDKFQSRHWDQADVLAHARIDERTAEDGRSLLFVEEIQSDWHQEGRERGYSPKNVPDAPLKKTWHEFVFKRIVQEAARSGKDIVAWTTGQQQTDRYYLSKEYDSIQWETFTQVDGKNVNKYDGKEGRLSVHHTDIGAWQSFHIMTKELSDYVGKEMAEDLLNQPKDERGRQTIEGIKLKIGGEGMKGFYDKILVDYANKLGKPYGAQVETVKISGGEQVHALPVPAALRDQALKGFSLFQGEVYHGAKVPFEEFDHDFMGSGEGSQVYGWGTYISESTQLARDAYAKKLGIEPSINWNGHSTPGLAVRAYRENYLGVRDIPQEWEGVMAQVLGILNEEIKPVVSVAGLIPLSKAASANNGTWKLKALIRGMLPKAIIQEKYQIELNPEQFNAGEIDVDAAMEEVTRLVNEATEPATQVYIEGGHWFYTVDIEPRGTPRKGSSFGYTGRGSALYKPVADENGGLNNMMVDIMAQNTWHDWQAEDFKKAYGYKPRGIRLQSAKEEGIPVGDYIGGALEGLIENDAPGHDGEWVREQMEQILGKGLAHAVIEASGAEAILEPSIELNMGAVNRHEAKLWTPMGGFDASDISNIAGAEIGQQAVDQVIQHIYDRMNSKLITEPVPSIFSSDIDDWTEASTQFEPDEMPPRVKAHSKALSAVVSGILTELQESFYDPNSEADLIIAAAGIEMWARGPEDTDPVFFLSPTVKGIWETDKTKQKIKAAEQVYDDAPGRWIRWDKDVHPDDVEIIAKKAEELRDALNGGEDDKLMELFGEETWVDLKVTAEEFETIAMGVFQFADADEFAGNAGERPTGAVLYKWIQESLDDNPEAASKFLLAAGFDGVRMPIRFLRGGRGEDGFNRVVFNDKAIKIRKRVLFQGDGADSLLPSQADNNPEPGAATIQDTARAFADNGQTWEEFAEFVDTPFMEEERVRWEVPDLPEKDRLAWYKTIFEEAISDGRKGAELGKWLAGLAENGYEPLKDFLRAVWTEVVLISESEPEPGSTEEDAQAWQESRGQAEQFREQIAEPIIAGALAIGAKRSTVSPQFLGSLYGIIRANPEEYAYIAGTIQGNAALADLGRQREEEKYQDIEDPKLREGMGIARRAALAAQIREERLAARIRTGAVVDQDIEDYIKKILSREKHWKAEQETAAKEMAGLESQLDARARQIADARRARTENLAEVKKLQRRLREYLDNNEPVPKSLEAQRERLEKRREAIEQKILEAGDWAELEAQLQNAEKREAAAQARIDEAHARGQAVERSDIEGRSRAHQEAAVLRAKLAEVKEYKNSAQLQTYLAKLEARTKAEDVAAERAAEKKALQEIRARRQRLIASIMRKPGDGVAVKQAKAINKIRAAINPQNASAKTLETVRGLREELEANPDLAREIPKAWLNRALKTNASEMSLRDLEETEKIVTELRRAGRAELSNKNRAIRDAREDAQIAVAEAMIGLPGYKPPKAPDQETLLDKLQGKFREIDYAFKNMRRFARDMDGGKDGINVQLLINQVNEAYRTERKEVARRKKAIMEGLEKLGIKPEDWYNEEIRIEGAGPGRAAVTLRKNQLLMMELAFRNEDSRAAVLFGNFFSHREKQSMDEEELLFEGAHRFALLRQAIDDNMTASDLAAIDQVFGTDSKATAPRLAETVADTENREFIEVDDYVPLHREGVTGTPIDVQLAEDINSRTPGLRKPPRNGFTKARVKISPKHQGRVKLDLLGLWMESIERQEHYIATARLGKELDGVYLSPYVQEQIRGAFGDAGVDYVKEYIAEVKNPGSLRQVNRWENSIRYLRGNLGIAYLAFRSSSVLKQVITSPWPALPYAGPRLFVEVMKMMANPMKYLRDTEELSIVLQNRTMDQVIEAIKEAEAGTPAGKMLLRIGQAGTKGLEYADRFSVAAGWRAVYETALEEFKGDHDKAVRKADDVILMTQPSARGVDLAPIYRRGGEATRLLLQFTMALNVIYQNIRYDVPNAIKNHQYGTAIGTLIGYAMAGILLNAATRGLPDDEDDWAKTITFWSMTQATDSLPLIGQDATRLLNRVITGQKEPQFPDTALPGVSKMIEGMYKLTDGDIERGLQQFAIGSGMILGIPTSGFTEVGRFIAGDPGALVGRPRKD